MGDLKAVWRQIGLARYTITPIRAPEYIGNISFSITSKSKIGKGVYNNGMLLTQDQLKRLIEDLQEYVEEK